jgi:hypothetical protein
VSLARGPGRILGCVVLVLALAAATPTALAAATRGDEAVGQGIEPPKGDLSNESGYPAAGVLAVSIGLGAVGVTLALIVRRRLASVRSAVDELA